MLNIPYVRQNYLNYNLRIITTLYNTRVLRHNEGDKQAQINPLLSQIDYLILARSATGILYFLEGLGQILSTNLQISCFMHRWLELHALEWSVGTEWPQIFTLLEILTCLVLLGM